MFASQQENIRRRLIRLTVSTREGIHRTPKRIHAGLVVLAILLCAPARLLSQQITPGFGAGTEDPRRILQTADEAIRKIRSLSYDASFQSIGSLSTLGGLSTGSVKLAKLDPDNPLKAMLIAAGKYIPSGHNEEQTFFVAFDGKTVTKIKSKEKALIYKSIKGDDPAERRLGFVTSFFGGGAYQLLMLEYILDEAYERQLSAPVAEYEGKASVNGVLCHVVYLEYLVNAQRTIRERWFFGVKDYLPRKFEHIVANDKGRYGAEVLSLSNLIVNAPLSRSAFHIQLPRGYTATPYKAPNQPALLAVGDLAPDWMLNDADGNRHTLSEYRGKIVMLDFWATWCGPCVRTMPEVQKLREQYSSNDLVVFGVNCWEESNPSAYMKQHGYTYGLLVKGEEITKAYRVETLPTVYVIGRDGRIIFRSVGIHDELRSLLESQFQFK